jgi:hypothetical protein
MTATDTSFSSKERGLVIALVVIAMIITTVAVVPSLRTQVKALFQNQNRHILAKVSGRLSAEGLQITVLKISTADGLSLEIYSSDQGPESQALIAKLSLNERRDAYFSFQGNATNLALTDVDNDGTLEIIAPTYDDQMVARLNIFKYNDGIKSFERMQSPPTE